MRRWSGRKFGNTVWRSCAGCGPGSMNAAPYLVSYLNQQKYYQRIGSLRWHGTVSGDAAARRLLHVQGACVVHSVNLDSHRLPPSVHNYSLSLSLVLSLRLHLSLLHPFSLVCWSACISVCLSCLSPSPFAACLIKTFVLKPAKM